MWTEAEDEEEQMARNLENLYNKMEQDVGQDRLFMSDDYDAYIEAKREYEEINQKLLKAKNEYCRIGQQYWKACDVRSRFEDTVAGNVYPKMKKERENEIENLKKLYKEVEGLSLKNLHKMNGYFTKSHQKDKDIIAGLFI